MHNIQYCSSNLTLNHFISHSVLCSLDLTLCFIRSLNLKFCFMFSKSHIMFHVSKSHITSLDLTFYFTFSKSHIISLNLTFYFAFSKSHIISLNLIFYFMFSKSHIISLNLIFYFAFSKCHICFHMFRFRVVKA